MELQPVMNLIKMGPLPPTTVLKICVISLMSSVYVMLYVPCRFILMVMVIIIMFIALYSIYAHLDKMDKLKNPRDAPLNREIIEKLLSQCKNNAAVTNTEKKIENVDGDADKSE